MLSSEDLKNQARGEINGLTDSCAGSAGSTKSLQQHKRDALLMQMNDLFTEIMSLECDAETGERSRVPDKTEMRQPATGFLHDIQAHMDRLFKGLHRKDKLLGGSASELRNISLSLFEDSPILIWKSGTDARCNYFNKSWLEFTGRTLEQELGDGWTEGIHPEDLEGCMNRYLNSFACKQPFEMEFRLRRCDGEYRWMHNVGKPVADQKGSFYGYIGGCFDATQHKQTESFLQRYKLISESTRDIILFLDENGKITEVNDAAAKAYGYTRDELLGMTIYDLQGVKRRGLQIKPLIDSQIAQAVSSGIFFETIHYRKDGSMFPVEVNSRGISDNKKSCLVSIARDITERKVMEAKLKEAYSSVDFCGKDSFLETKLSFLTYHDQLTGVNNRKFFDMKIREYEKDISAVVGLVICNINGLKLINNVFGHDCGDLLLKEAAGIISRCTGDRGFVARLSGDEFAVILPNCTEATAQEVIAEIGKAAENSSRSKRFPYLSISSGFAIRDNGSLTFEELSRNIDNAIIAEKLNKSESIQDEISKTLIKTLEAKNHVTEEHSCRLQEYILLLSNEIDMKDTNLTHLQLLARFHDMGKISIPEHVLNKQGPLTQKEMEAVKNHCLSGYRIASSVKSLNPISDWILKHHERWDGKGYPMGMKEEEIPLACRILSVLEAYDAMVSVRPYRKAMSQQEAVEELKRCSGMQFDPMVVDSFIRVLDKCNSESKVINYSSKVRGGAQKRKS